MFSRLSWGGWWAGLSVLGWLGGLGGSCGCPRGSPPPLLFPSESGAESRHGFVFLITPLPLPYAFSFSAHARHNARPSSTEQRRHEVHSPAARSAARRFAADLRLLSRQEEHLEKPLVAQPTQFLHGVASAGGGRRGPPNAHGSSAMALWNTTIVSNLFPYRRSAKAKSVTHLAGCL